MSAQTCPLCQSKDVELTTLDANLKSRIMAESGQIMEAICQECFEKFNKLTERRKGAVYSKDQQRLTLWRSRIQLIKDARDKFMSRDYAGAAVAYEKYFKIVEIIYDAKVPHLVAKEFANPGRAKEMGIMTTAFWDLVRVYDLSPKYKPKLELYARKLGEFLPHTDIHGDLITKIMDYRAAAKNKEVFDRLYKVAKKKSGRRCFIASAAFESPLAPEVIVLSRFRDEVLAKNLAGRAFIATYYFVSPGIAAWIDQSSLLRKMVRAVLVRVARMMDRER